MNKVKFSHILLIIVVCFVSRLPLLINSELILDGDECVVAMMAKNAFSGKELPMFFYGQNYGFAFIEVLTILPFYLFLGFSTFAVKLAMLTLWTTGVVFFYLNLKQIKANYKYLPLLITLLLIASPAWAVFSMKAYGGYLTAFCLGNLILYLIFHQGYGRRRSTYLWVGALLAIILQAQILWLPGLICLLAYKMYQDGFMKKAVLIAIPFTIITAAFYVYKQDLPRYLISARYNPLENLWEQISRIPRFVFCTMNGHHELWMRGDAGLFCGAFAFIMTGLALLLPVLGAYFFFAKREKRLLFVASTVSVALTIALTTCTFHIQGKYLLPLTAYLLFSLFILLASLPFSRWVYRSFIPVIALGVLCLATFKIFHFPATDPRSLKNTIRYLEDNNTFFVYSTLDMLGWQIVFYSGERIISRPPKYPGRYGAYASKIDSALNNGRNIAIIGYIDSSFFEYKYQGGKEIGNMFIYLKPAKEKLSEQFEFKIEEKFTPL